jgi:hypothetical protein
MLSKDFTIMVLIASIIGFPIGCWEKMTPGNRGEELLQAW